MEHDILEFNREIRVCIPKKYLRNLYHQHRVISYRDEQRIKRFCAQIEEAEKRLAHARSVGECLLLRRY